MARVQLRGVKTGHFSQEVALKSRIKKIGRDRTYSLQERMVRSRGLEPPRVLPHSDLNAARLPIPPRPHCLGLVKRALNKAFQDVKRKSAQAAEIIVSAPPPAPIPGSASGPIPQKTPVFQSPALCSKTKVAKARAPSARALKPADHSQTPHAPATRPCTIPPRPPPERATRALKTPKVNQPRSPDPANLSPQASEGGAAAQRRA